MKLGCSVWTFTKPSYNAPYESAIQTIAELGFEGVELIVFSEQDLEEYYTPERVESLTSLMRNNRLALSEVAVFDSVVGGLSSLEKTRKQHALESFERCAGLAARLGSRIINMVSQWPEGLEGPTSYPPHAIYLLMKGQQYFHPKNTLKLPEDFSWKEVWENYVDSIRQACRIAARFDLRLALEGHTHVIVPGVDSMLRLIDWVGEDNLGVNLDTGWHFTQREYIPLTILKLGDRVFHVHTRDGDGILSYGLPPGSGILDWEEIIKALRTVGYDGFLSFEMTRYEDPGKYAKVGLDYLQKLLAR